MGVVLAGELVERPRQGVPVDALMFGAGFRLEVRGEPPYDATGLLVDECDDVRLARADQDVVGRKDGRGIGAVPPVGAKRLGAVELQIPPYVVGLARQPGESSNWES